MKKYDQFKRLIIFSTAMIILLLQTAIFAFFWHGYYNNIIVQPFFRRGSWVMISIYALLLLIFTKVYGGFRIGYYKKSDVIFSQLLGILFVNGITYLQISLLGLRFVNIGPLLIMMFLEICIIFIWAFISNALFAKLFPPRRMLLLYGDTPPDNMIMKMSTRNDRYQICAIMNVNKGYDAIIHALKDFDAVIIWDITSSIRNPILKYCFGHSVRTYIMPKLSDIIVMRSDDINLFDTPLLLSRNIGLTFDQKFAKRMMDIILAVLFTIVSSPFMLLVALAIKLYDHGPIFYKQERYTIDGKVFRMYKFRSMVVDAEKDGIARLAEENDDRITPIGKFLRTFRLDELPQLFNIIAGDMSLVGPRPERPEIADEFYKDMPEFEYRLKMKAGLTGYAQVYGNYSTTPYDKLKLDITYIESYSFWLDIKLILLTFKMIFRKDSSKGLQENQILTAKQMNQYESEFASTLEVSEKSCH